MNKILKNSNISYAMIGIIAITVSLTNCKKDIFGDYVERTSSTSAPNLGSITGIPSQIVAGDSVKRATVNYFSDDAEISTLSLFTVEIPRESYIFSLRNVDDKELKITIDANNASNRKLLETLTADNYDFYQNFTSVDNSFRTVFDTVPIPLEFAAGAERMASLETDVLPEHLSVLVSGVINKLSKQLLSSFLVEKSQLISTGDFDSYFDDKDIVTGKGSVAITDVLKRNNVFVELIRSLAYDYGNPNKFKKRNSFEIEFQAEAVDSRGNLGKSRIAVLKVQ